jgi:hypothetical protein
MYFKCSQRLGIKEKIKVVQQPLDKKVDSRYRYAHRDLRQKNQGCRKMAKNCLSRLRKTSSIYRMKNQQ